LLIAGPHYHFTGWIQRSQTGKNPLRVGRLVGNEADREGSRLAGDPFVETAAHPAAAVVEDFDSFSRWRQFHRVPFGSFSVY
jgi:hypothetical protein